MENLREEFINILENSENMVNEEDRDKRSTHSHEIRKRIKEIAERLKIKLSAAPEAVDS